MGCSDLAAMPPAIAIGSEMQPGSSMRCWRRRGHGSASRSCWTAGWEEMGKCAVKSRHSAAGDGGASGP